MGQVSILEDILKLQESLDHWRYSNGDKQPPPRYQEEAAIELRALIETLDVRLRKLRDIADHPDLEKAIEIEQLSKRVYDLESKLESSQISRVVSSSNPQAIDRLRSENAKLRTNNKLGRQREEKLKRILRIQKQKYENLRRTDGMVLKPKTRP